MHIMECTKSSMRILFDEMFSTECSASLSYRFGAPSPRRSVQEAIQNMEEKVASAIDNVRQDVGKQYWPWNHEMDIVCISCLCVDVHYIYIHIHAGLYFIVLEWSADGLFSFFHLWLLLKAFQLRFGKLISLASPDHCLFLWCNRYLLCLTHLKSKARKLIQVHAGTSPHLTPLASLQAWMVCGQGLQWPLHQFEIPVAVQRPVAKIGTTLNNGITHHNNEYIECIDDQRSCDVSGQ